jgi:hypothetical protein
MKKKKKMRKKGKKMNAVRRESVYGPAPMDRLA